MRSSCGAVFGIAKIVAISPSWLARGGRDLGHARACRRRPSGASASCASLSARALRDVDREQERAVGAGAERLAQLVVGDALGLGLGLVAVVGLAETQLRDRRREHQQHEHAGRDRQPRARGDDLAPAAERGDGCACSGFFGASQRPKRADHDRQDRERGDDDRADGDRRREAELADERDPDHEQARDREHHHEARGDHRRAGRGRRLRRRVATAVPRGDLLAVAADDQQRVVDAGAEAEHHRDHRRERRQVERRRQRRRAGSGRPSRRSARRSASPPSPRASGTGP